MNDPWILCEQYQDKENQAGLRFYEYTWQALFGCQVLIRPHSEWVKLKWGFNASALFEEALERQRLFLETQYTIRNELRMEGPDHRTLALRYVSRPGEGLLVAVLGKIHARSEAEARQSAMALYRELRSTFPYDYFLIPARSGEELARISGWDLLGSEQNECTLAQIKRSEVPVLPDRRSPILQGLWQSNARAHEQIWRTLAAAIHPLLLNISLRSTILYPKEQEYFSNCTEDMAEAQNHATDDKAFQAMKNWSEAYTARRLTPWKKFFYLQLHLASTQPLDENLFRVAGTSLTLGSEKLASLGYQAIAPRPDKVQDWRQKIRNLDVVFPATLLPFPRLADVADLEEVFDVIRLPYSPPEDGFPDVKFAAPLNP